MLFILTRWFTRAERSRANAILIMGNPITVLWMSAATGYLIQAVGWQKTFIYEGLPSVLWAFAWFSWCRISRRRRGGCPRTLSSRWKRS